MLADQTQERKKEIWDAVTESASRYVDDTGNVK